MQLRFNFFRKTTLFIIAISLSQIHTMLPWFTLSWHTCVCPVKIDKSLKTSCDCQHSAPQKAKFFTKKKKMFIPPCHDNALAYSAKEDLLPKVEKVNMVEKVNEKGDQSSSRNNISPRSFIDLNTSPTDSLTDCSLHLSIYKIRLTFYPQSTVLFLHTQPFSQFYFRLEIKPG